MRPEPTNCDTNTWWEWYQETREERRAAAWAIIEDSDWWRAYKAYNPWGTKPQTERAVSSHAV